MGGDDGGLGADQALGITCGCCGGGEDEDDDDDDEEDADGIRAAARSRQTSASLSELRRSKGCFAGWISSSLAWSRQCRSPRSAELRHWFGSFSSTTSPRVFVASEMTNAHWTICEPPLLIFWRAKCRAARKYLSDVPPVDGARDRASAAILPSEKFAFAARGPLRFCHRTATDSRQSDGRDVRDAGGDRDRGRS
jgi:hypothetical protein